MHISRRSLFAGFSGASLLALAGCAGLTGQQVAQKVVTDVELIASGFAKALPTVKAIPASTTTLVVGYMNEAVTLAQGISSSLTQTAAQPLVGKIVNDVNAAIQAAALLPLPPPIQQMFAAVGILLPILEVGVGLPVTVSAPKTGETPAQARAYLAAFKG